jgi:hypothetical protein
MGWAKLGRGCHFLYMFDLFYEIYLKHWSTGVAADLCFVGCGFMNIHLAIYGIYLLLRIESLNDISWPIKAVRRRNHSKKVRHSRSLHWCMFLAFLIHF